MAKFTREVTDEYKNFFKSIVLEGTEEPLTFTDDEINSIAKYSGLRNVTIIFERLNYYRKFFKLKNSEIKTMIKRGKNILDLTTIVKDPNKEGVYIEGCVERKYRYFEKNFGFNRADFARGLVINPRFLDLSLDQEIEGSILKKANYFKNTLFLSDDQFTSILKSNINVITKDTIGDNPTSIPSKIKFYKENLKLNERQLGHMLYVFSKFFDYDTTGEGKALDEEIDNTTVVDKMNFYMKALNISKIEFGNMLYLFPSIISLDTTSNSLNSVGTKIDVIKTIMPTSVIVEKPIVLNVPAQRIRLRHIILSLAGKNKITKEDESVEAKENYLDYSPNNLVTSEQTTFARLCDLRDKKIPITVSKIGRGEKDYFKKYGPYNKTDYPLTLDAILKLQEEYNKLFPNNKITLTEDEIKATLKGEGNLSKDKAVENKKHTAVAQILESKALGQSQLNTRQLETRQLETSQLENIELVTSELKTSEEAKALKTSELETSDEVKVLETSELLKLRTNDEDIHRNADERYIRQDDLNANYAVKLVGQVEQVG